jgi:hypothetical protein
MFPFPHSDLEYEKVPVQSLINEMRSADLLSLLSFSLQVELESERGTVQRLTSEMRLEGSLPMRIFPSLQGNLEYKQGSVHYVKRLTNEMRQADLSSLLSRIFSFLLG